MGDWSLFGIAGLVGTRWIYGGDGAVEDGGGKRIRDEQANQFCPLIPAVVGGGSVGKLVRFLGLEETRVSIVMQNGEGGMGRALDFWGSEGWLHRMVREEEDSVSNLWWLYTLLCYRDCDGEKDRFLRCIVTLLLLEEWTL